MGSPPTSPPDPAPALARLRAGSVEPEPDPRDLSGVMTAERGRALDGRAGVRSGFGASERKSGENASAINALDHDLMSETAEGKSGECASNPVEKIDMGQLSGISGTLPGLLAADIARLIHPERRRQFDAALFGGVGL